MDDFIKRQIGALLVVASWAAVGSSSGALNGPPSSRSHLEPPSPSAAAAQLQRLAAFRDANTASPSVSESLDLRQPEQDLGDDQHQPTDDSDSERAELPLHIPIDLNELLRIFGASSGANAGIAAGNDDTDAEASEIRQNIDLELTPERMNKLDAYAEKLMRDERVQSIVRERTKRDGYTYGPPKPPGSDSGNFLSGLAGQIVGSVVGLSSSASRTSSSSSGGHGKPAVGYGPPPSYDTYGQETFGFFSFKKAILNTLVQAVKAVSGGVLALSGKIVKGSGFIVSTKGKLLGSAGDAIVGIGKNLASSATVQVPSGYPPPHYGYNYNAPAAQFIGHDSHYDGPPPSTDNFQAFGAPSDDDGLQPGLLIGKPAHTESFGAGFTQADFSGQGLPQLPAHSQAEDFNAQDTSHGNDGGQSTEEPPAIPTNTLQLQDQNQANNELYPPLGNGPLDDGKMLQLPPKFDSPPVNFHSGSLPSASLPSVGFHGGGFQSGAFQNPSFYNFGHPTFNNYPLHNYIAPLKHGASQPDIQIEIADHDITGFETGGFSQFTKHPGPLKVPLLSHETLNYYRKSGPSRTYRSSPTVYAHYSRYRPSLEVKTSVAHEIRERKDQSKLLRT
ncbi:hypothetical protein QAD02_001937 [Eretmocerus hayati]|uniref:Uncharacterized protein n=1 Tax=Eretmocerus hayati TaxID=131215 RepID=A0ACC2NIE9_9HYME|nr:hypothetical protein QAD02_001937 [Eretmocerus hayati]